MLSTEYRLKMQSICERIVNHQEVTLEEMIWANKLSKANGHAATMLRQAQRKAQNPEMTEDSLDGFLNALDLGPVDPNDKGVSGFNSPDEIVDWFRRKDDEDGENWRRRD